MNRRRLPRRRRDASISEVRVSDPDLRALWHSKTPEGQAILVVLQEARDRGRTAAAVKPPSPAALRRMLDDGDFLDEED